MSVQPRRCSVLCEAAWAAASLLPAWSRKNKSGWTAPLLEFNHSTVVGQHAKTLLSATPLRVSYKRHITEHVEYGLLPPLVAVGPQILGSR